MRFPSGVTEVVSRRCSKCGARKPENDFGIDRHQVQGRKSQCKDCINGARRGRYQAENREHHLRSKYGITSAEYARLLLKQGGCCAICGTRPVPRTGGARAKDSTPLFVDHCHKTNRIRGLLCHNCNVALGLFKEDAGRIRSALDYLGVCDADT